MRWAEPAAPVIAVVEVPRRVGLDELVAANAVNAAGLDLRVEPAAHRLVSLAVAADGKGDSSGSARRQSVTDLFQKVSQLPS